jgi:thymidylate synthase
MTTAHQMHQYHDLLSEILTNGSQQPNRTGTDTLMIDGAMMQFNQQYGFPAITTKKLAFNQMKGELVGFIRGVTSAADFRELGCSIWDQNANENKDWLNNPYRRGEDDLGCIYGEMWRSWPKLEGGTLDQLGEAIRTIIVNPTNRRIIINAWRPDMFDRMALPPCHVMYQFLVDTRKQTLNMCMYQRSCDMFLGVPFNIASASLLLSIVAKITGYKPGNFTHFLADAHIYVNHIEQVKTQLSRDHYPAPRLKLDWYAPSDEWRSKINSVEHHVALALIDAQLQKIEPDMIMLLDYQSHDAIPAPMAV